MRNTIERHKLRGFHLIPLAGLEGHPHRNESDKSLP